MRPPRLSRPLHLEAAERVADGAGGFVESWAARGTLWAELRLSSGRGTPGAAAALSLARYRITVRAAPQGAAARPVPGQRFRDGARLFRILAVSEADAAGRFLTCYAEEERVA